MCDNREMARKYELKRRAERKEETRRRIVEAAIDLHATVGPARATVSAIAERAGVQRHTFYRHFPDERSLGDACSGLHLERHPLPEPGTWRQMADPRARMRAGLDALYAYFAANEGMLANVLRDAEVHELTREIVQAKIGPPLEAIQEVLVAGFGVRGGRRLRLRAAVGLATDFQTWRLLVRRSGMPQADAVELMTRLVACAAD
jgi:AcrR family transcriptional regulator